MDMNHQRPDPDALLAHVEEQERRAKRGKLRIYFGACAGVGKTYAMLSATRKLKAEGHDVIVGVAETHGRSETAVLLEGLEVLPRKPIKHHDKMIDEFDIDAALARQPAMIVVDELAHSNAPGTRHPKRWQDVKELLDSGIDVFTTLNVQHLESLNDVVGGITGIRVSETLPDTVFDHADEVVLVDIPADELLARLKVGKVYQSDQALLAANNFFRKGNLIALRELALRRTATRVESDVQAYRIEKSINRVWKTDTTLLACIGHRVDAAEYIIRSTARIASQMNTNWQVVYVETPALQHLPPVQRERILKTLKLGEELGASTVMLSGQDIAKAIVDYARSRNFSTIIIGRSHSKWPWHIPNLKRIASLAPDIDFIELSLVTSKPMLTMSKEDGSKSSTRREGEVEAGKRKRHAWSYALAIGASVLTALIALPLLPVLKVINIAMLFFLTIVIVAARLGRGQAVTTTVFSIALFDFFFVPPRYSFAVDDVQYVMTFAVMLIVGLIAAQLTSGLRFQAKVALQRETRFRALYEFSRALSSALETEQIVTTTVSFIANTFQGKVHLLLPNVVGHVQIPSTVKGDALGLDIGIAQWAFDHATAAGIGTDTLPGSRYFYLPLMAPMRTRGVLAIEPRAHPWLFKPEQQQQLDTFATLAAIALERVHYTEVAQDALVQMESERLRNRLLTRPRA